MENHNESGSPAVTPLGTISNARMRMLANRTPPVSTPDNVNPRPWDMVPPTQQVLDFYERRPRDEQATVQALRNPFHDFVTALLDFLEPGLCQVGIVTWQSPLIRTLLCDFGWRIINVWSRNDEGELVTITIQRPSRFEEERARAKTTARRARGIVESPLPRTYFEVQMHDFVDDADEDMIAFMLTHAKAPLALQVLIECLVPLYAADWVPYGSPVVRILLDKFDWHISGGGSLFEDGSFHEQLGMVRIQPPPKPKKRLRVAREPPRTHRVAMSELRHNRNRGTR